MTPLVVDAWKEVGQLLRRQEQSVAHRLDHVERVYTNAMRLADRYPDVDIELLQLSVLFHDICQPYDKKDQHVALSGRLTRETLQALNCPAERIEQVLAVISEHSTEHIDTVKPQRIEAQILFDADKLDGLGAIGIARVFGLFGQRGRTPAEAIDWYYDKIEKARANMQTPGGRGMFEERLEFVLDFLTRFQTENESHTLPGQGGTEKGGGGAYG